MELIKTTTKKQLDELYNCSAFTIIGCHAEDPEELKLIKKWFTDLKVELKKDECHHILGSTMNKVYGLTGTNAYPDDLNILSFKLDNFKDSSPLVFARFAIGARWFDDIVDNNKRRQKRIRMFE